MIKFAFTLGLTLLTALPAAADAMIYPRHRTYYHRHYLPPERHVIEVVTPPYSGNFIINGRRFTAMTTACFGWNAGERIKLIAGDWNGFCDYAVFYNVPRRHTCEMWCR